MNNTKTLTDDEVLNQLSARYHRNELDRNTYRQLRRDFIRKRVSTYSETMSPIVADKSYRSENTTSTSSIKTKRYTNILLVTAALCCVAFMSIFMLSTEQSDIHKDSTDLPEIVSATKAALVDGNFTAIEAVNIIQIWYKSDQENRRLYREYVAQSEFPSSGIEFVVMTWAEWLNILEDVENDTVSALFAAVQINGTEENVDSSVLSFIEMYKVNSQDDRATVEQILDLYLTAWESDFDKDHEVFILEDIRIKIDEFDSQNVASEPVKQTTDARGSSKTVTNDVPEVDLSVTPEQVFSGIDKVDVVAKAETTTTETKVTTQKISESEKMKPLLVANEAKETPPVNPIQIVEKVTEEVPVQVSPALPVSSNETKSDGLIAVDEGKGKETKVTATPFEDEVMHLEKLLDKDSILDQNSLRAFRKHFIDAWKHLRADGNEKYVADLLIARLSRHANAELHCKAIYAEFIEMTVAELHPNVKWLWNRVFKNFEQSCVEQL